MYNTKYTTTYNSENIFLETDDVNEKDKEFIVNVLYRKDLCNIFNIDYDNFPNGNVFDEKISELYKIIIQNVELLSLTEKLSTFFFNSPDKDLGLMLLLSFDFLYLSHPCFCEYIETGKITEDTFYKLYSYLEKEMLK